MSSLTKWERMVGDPFRTLDLVQSRLGRLISDIDSVFDKRFYSNEELNPRVDITEDQDTLYYMMELPGVKQENIDISVSDGTLTVHGKKDREESKKDHRYQRYERIYGEFTRSFTLPEGTNADMVQASFDNGVLEVRIPLPRGVKNSTKRIKIASGNQRLETAKARNDHQKVVS